MSLHLPRARRLLACFLIGIAWIPLGRLRAADEGRLHVILAADRAQPGIGADMAVSRDAVLRPVIRNTPRDRCAIWEINRDPAKVRDDAELFHTQIRSYGRELSREAMLGAIRNLRVGPEDAILFYYCGHGAYSPTYGTYTLASGDRGGGGLFLSELRTEMARMRPRFSAVVLDCCNNLRPIPGEPRPSAGVAEHRPDGFSPLFRRLFFSRPGTLSITSSKPGEYALVLPATRSRNGVQQHFGSLFSTRFAGAISEGMEDALEWDAVLRMVQAEVDEEFGRICRSGQIPLGNGRVVSQARQTIESRW